MLAGTAVSALAYSAVVGVGALEHEIEHRSWGSIASPAFNILLFPPHLAYSPCISVRFGFSLRHSPLCRRVGGVSSSSTVRGSGFRSAERCSRGFACSRLCALGCWNMLPYGEYVVMLPVYARRPVYPCYLDVSRLTGRLCYRDTHARRIAPARLHRIFGAFTWHAAIPMTLALAQPYR